ncbi:hypothetical protein KIH39_17585 [Telmatocola sphagniphila]|uniref:Uncharacterized protein n=1 Tax=Telmatocola sphagniphila TaxID=1123043 RepID=A0A8E6B2J3_9BACT|nr:hypothetical protein [Telmatocola sphagniphila]QVL30657.1 hypothetical protein KIH39_17585 [Telmatocola sphagniphila]
MRRGQWTAGLLGLGIFAFWILRTASGDKSAHAQELQLAGNVAEVKETESDPAPSEHEMAEYRYRMNMPRHWRYVMLRR